MMSETAKHRNIFTPFCNGNGLDIGFGGDPIVPWAITFDLPNRYSNVGDKPQNIRGDARDLSIFSDNSLDFVYSSHCIEDFEDTEAVLVEWLRVIKVGGFLCLLFPDEREYRKKSKTHNANHKHLDFGLQLVLNTLSGITKKQMYILPFPVICTELFENNDYNCAIVIQKDSFVTDSL